MGAVAIQAKWSKDTNQFDGLDPHAEELIDKPHQVYVIVATVEVVEIKNRPLDGTAQPKIRIKHVELVEGRDAVRVTGMLEKIYTKRTGRDDAPQDSLFDRQEMPDDGPPDVPGVEFTGPTES